MCAGSIPAGGPELNNKILIMKASVLSLLWCVLFIGCIFTVGGLTYLFWLFLAGFCVCCLYAKVHKSRLLREIDEMFGDGSNF